MVLPQERLVGWASGDAGWTKDIVEFWAMTKYLIDQAGIGSAPGGVFGPAVVQPPFPTQLDAPLIL